MRRQSGGGSSQNRRKRGLVVHVHSRDCRNALWRVSYSRPRVQRQDVENLAKVNWSVGRRKGDLEYRTHENSSMKARRSGFGWDDFSIFVVPIARMPDF
jgi:hypothetical protein